MDISCEPLRRSMCAMQTEQTASRHGGFRLETGEARLQDMGLSQQNRSGSGGNSKWHSTECLNTAYTIPSPHAVGTWMGRLLWINYTDRSYSRFSSIPQTNAACLLHHPLHNIFRCYSANICKEINYLALSVSSFAVTLRNLKEYEWR